MFLLGVFFIFGIIGSAFMPISDVRNGPGPAGWSKSQPAGSWADHTSAQAPYRGFSHDRRLHGAGLRLFHLRFYQRQPLVFQGTS